MNKKYDIINDLYIAMLVCTLLLHTFLFVDGEKKYPQKTNKNKGKKDCVQNLFYKWPTQKNCARKYERKMFCYKIRFMLFCIVILKVCTDPNFARYVFFFNKTEFC